MPLPIDYVERTYAGVLGKLIGVYLGRPFEGWTYEQIMQRLGEVHYYVHDRLGKPLIVTDDDISGTFTFLRALPDYGNRPDLTPWQIGQSWLNYIIEERSILWWGGLGNSTEHTAFLRMLAGVMPPTSGSIQTNGKVVAEQIGSQIFIDGWAMVAPGDPERAADLARRAASVSHDGEAIYGAQVVAAMESYTYVESDLDKLMDTAVALIPSHSLIYRMIAQIREWHAGQPDWRQTREQIARHYGYDQYGGNCHMVPNHALIIHSLLYGQGDFQKSLMIVNTCGWDTDCNAGNVGCLLGIRNGLAGLDAGPDWRGPVADRLYLSTADGGRAITDAVTESYHVVNIGRALVGEPALSPKDGARFHFELPGSVQGFRPESGPGQGAGIAVENVAGFSTQGSRSLALRYRHVAAHQPVRIATPTFTPPEAREMPGYVLMASPTLYPGQTVTAQISADQANAMGILCQLYVRVYGANDELLRVAGPEIWLDPGAPHKFVWTLPETAGAPIAEIGLELRSDHFAEGTVYLDSLTWAGVPEMLLTKPEWGGVMWRRAWVDAVDQAEGRWPESFRLAQNRGTGMLIHGGREWTDYQVSADVTPHLVKSAGIGARVQGLKRYYALLLVEGGKVRLVKELDGERVLAEQDFNWRFGATYDLALHVMGNTLTAAVDGQTIFRVTDADQPLNGGGIALICQEGRTATQAVRVGPI